MMIRIGQAGIPLSCKGRTNKDGLIYTKEILDLNAMEVQFVRGLYVMEDEEAIFMKEYAEESDVELHVHAPYYINLAGEDELELSFEKIMNSAIVADKMGAETVVVHPGYYGDKTEEQTLKTIIKNTKKLQKLMKKEKLKVKIGLETMGKQKVFGTLDEIIEVCQKVENAVPVIDLGHWNIDGMISVKDFQKASLYLNSKGHNLAGWLHDYGYPKSNDTKETFLTKRDESLRKFTKAEIIAGMRMVPEELPLNILIVENNLSAFKTFEDVHFQASPAWR